MGELAAFLGVALLVIVTPGPDTVLTIRNTLLGGRAGGVCTAFGVASGQACWTLATSAGVAALLVASEPAFLAVKLAGAVPLTLLWLTLYAIAVAKADAFFSRSRVRRALDGLTGAVLVALGLRLATAQR